MLLCARAMHKQAISACTCSGSARLTWSANRMLESLLQCLFASGLFTEPSEVPLLWIMRESLMQQAEQKGKTVGGRFWRRVRFTRPDQNNTVVYTMRLATQSNNSNNNTMKCPCVTGTQPYGKLFARVWVLHGVKGRTISTWTPSRHVPKAASVSFFSGPWLIHSR